MSKAPSSAYSKPQKCCKKSGVSVPTKAPTPEPGEHSELVSLPDGVTCETCQKVLKNRNGLSRHMRKVHKVTAPDKAEPKETDQPVAPASLSPPAACPQNGLTVNEHFEETQKLMNNLTTGTEITGHVEDAMQCGVCKLKVEKSTYIDHILAHFEAARLQYAYLGQVMDRSVECLKSLKQQE